MNTRFKVFASYNILQYLCDFIHVLIFVTVSKCQKSPKLTNIEIKLHLMNLETPHQPEELRRLYFLQCSDHHYCCLEICILILGINKIKLTINLRVSHRRNQRKLKRSANQPAGMGKTSYPAIKGNCIIFLLFVDI
jgi:hypothetical protein